MTQADRDRLVTLKKAKKKLITQKDAAIELGITERQVSSHSVAVDESLSPARGEAVRQGREEGRCGGGGGEPGAMGRDSGCGTRGSRRGAADGGAGPGGHTWAQRIEEQVLEVMTRVYDA